MDRGNWEELAFAEGAVVACAEHGDVVRDLQSRIENGGFDPRGVRVVEAEDAKRFGRLCEFPLQPAREGLPVIGLRAAWVEGPGPAGNGLIGKFPGEGRVAEFVLVSPAGRIPGDVPIVAGTEMLRGEASNGGIVAADAGKGDVGTRGSEVDDGDAASPKGANLPKHRLVVTQGDQCAVAGPAVQSVRETVRHREMPAVGACEARNAGEPSGRGRRDEQEHVLERHGGESSTRERKTQVVD